MKKSTGLSVYGPIAKMVFWLYVALVFFVVILKFNGSWQVLLERARHAKPWSHYNLQIGYTIHKYMMNLNAGWARLNIAGNILPFIPIGLFMPWAYKAANKIIWVLCCGILLITAMEFVQLATGLGTFDVDDILLNVLGILAGWIVYRILFQRKSGTMP